MAQNNKTPAPESEPQRGDDGRFEKAEAAKSTAPVAKAAAKGGAGKSSGNQKAKSR